MTKRKAEVIDLEADDASDGNTPYFFNGTSPRNISHLPRHRLASLALSDSSRTLSPELQIPIPKPSPLGNKASHRHTIPGREQRAVEGRQMNNFDPEVIEIRPTDVDKGEIIDIEALESELEKDIFQVGVEGEVVFTEAWKRNPPTGSQLRTMSKVIGQDGAYLRPGQMVELNNGSFLEIKTILENVQSKDVVLRGWELNRTRDLDGELILKLNEVCYNFEIDLDDPRPMREQSIIEANFKDIKKVRRLTRTNYHLPAFRFDIECLPAGDNHTKRRHVEENEGLVVRWQYITTFKTAKDREQQFLTSANYTSRKLVRLDKKDCDDKCHVPLFALRCQWRGDTALELEEVEIIGQRALRTSSNNKENPVSIDGSDNEMELSQKERSLITPTDTRMSIHISSHDFDQLSPWVFVQTMRHRYDAKVKLKGQRRKNIGQERQTQFKDTNARAKTCNADGQKLNSQTTAPVRKYSYADAFCGAGGATRGAVMAGLRVIWGLDFNPNAAETWRYNFPQAEMHEMWADEFCRLPDPEGKCTVDVLHLSPPCQVWSPAHTIAGKDDDMNFASLYAVQELIAKAKPRIVTLEQTFGIIHRRFRNPFNSLIRMFTDQNFSVSWQIVELERLGLPQRRKRLIIIAAAPGDTLPPFPAYTHSRDGGNGLQVFRSAGRALSSIPTNAENHEIPNHRPGNYMPWDPSTILPNCITTAGANGRGHPSGQRGLTCREVASLQTFPHHHVFRRLGIRKQIGNAVPPLIGKIVFSSVRKHLEKVDGEEHERVE